MQQLTNLSKFFFSHKFGFFPYEDFSEGGLGDCSMQQEKNVCLIGGMD